MQSEKDGGEVTMEVEIGEMSLFSKECGQPSEPGEGEEIALKSCRRSVVLTTYLFQPNETDLGLLASKTVREQISVFFLSYHIFGNLL